MNDPIVVILEKITILAMRMRRILEGGRICVYDADSKYKLYNTIDQVGDGASLVILDLDIEHDLAIATLKETRQKAKSSTPILVMTSARERNFFVEAMLSGASDFILKPFTNEVFLSKVWKYLYPESAPDEEIVTTNLDHYLKGELRKAEKGNFALSVLFLAFEREGDEGESPAAEAYIYENMKKLFWDTDIFMRFAGKYYLGIFPFCGEDNTGTIGQKIQSEFEKLKETNDMLRGYREMHAFVSYPADTCETAKVYELLLSRVREQLSQNISFAPGL